MRDTGIGIAEQQQRDHLRGVPPGRRQHAPQVRRHRARPVDLARPRAAARRRHHRAEHARRRQHVHADGAARLHGPHRADVAPAAAHQSRTADRDSATGRRCRRQGGVAVQGSPLRSAGRRRRRAGRRHSSAGAAGALSIAPVAIEDDRDALTAGHRGASWSSRTTCRSPRSCATSRASWASSASSTHSANDGVAAALAYRPSAIAARRQPAGSFRARRARSAEAQSADAPHPGARRVGRGLHAGSARARRDRLCAEAGEARSSWSTRSSCSKRSCRRACGACWSSKTTSGSARASGSCSKAETCEIVGVENAGDALAQLAAQTFDCMVMDLNLPDLSGYELLEQMAEQERRRVPAGDRLHRPLADARRGAAAAALLEVDHHQGRAVARSGCWTRSRCSCTRWKRRCRPSASACCSRRVTARAALEGRRILVVEDDVRNIFALSSVLEPKGATVEIARNGREALDVAARARVAAGAGDRSGADGHHDAGDGRPDRDARDPQAAASGRSCRSSR